MLEDIVICRYFECTESILKGPPEMMKLGDYSQNRKPLTGQDRPASHFHLSYRLIQISRPRIIASHSPAKQATLRRQRACNVESFTLPIATRSTTNLRDWEEIEPISCRVLGVSCPGGNRRVNDFIASRSSWSRYPRDSGKFSCLNRQRGWLWHHFWYNWPTSKSESSSDGGTGLLEISLTPQAPKHLLYLHFSTMKWFWLNMVCF